MPAQITTFPKGLTVNTDVGKVAWPTCSKTMSGASPRICLTRFAEVARDAEAGLLLIGRLSACAHHPRELRPVDVVDGAEALDELALLRGGDDAHAVRTRGRAELGREHAEAAGGAPDQDIVAGLQVATRDAACGRR